MSLSEAAILRTRTLNLEAQQARTAKLLAGARIEIGRLQERVTALEARPAVALDPASYSSYAPLNVNGRNAGNVTSVTITSLTAAGRIPCPCSFCAHLQGAS